MAVTERTAELFERLYAMEQPFSPTAFFDTEMDQLIYIASNRSYRAERVDVYLTILWDTDELKVVGIKLKGFRSVFDDLKAAGLVEEEHFVPLCKAISLLMRRAVDASHPADDAPADNERHKWYRKAEEFVGDYRFDERRQIAA